MRITSVGLENIKSYTRATIDLSAGINAICGPNGSGKTTLLEAIGFALFDYLPYGQAAFLREGQTSGTIRVRLLARDERQYEIVRKIGAGASHYVSDVDAGLTLAERRENVCDWVRGHGLGMEGDVDLSALFLNALGVPQGRMTADFQVPAGARKKVFDPLLRVEEYANAYRDLHKTVGHVSDAVARVREDIARLETAVQRIPGIEEELSALREGLQTVEGQLRELNAEERMITNRKQELDSLEEQLRDLTSKLQEAKAKVELRDEQLSSCQEAYDRAVQAKVVVDRTSDGFQRLQRAAEQLEGLEQQRQERDQLRTEWDRLEGQKEPLQKHLSELESDLKGLHQQANEATLLAEPAMEQEKLEQERDALAKRLEDLGELVGFIAETRLGLDEYMTEDAPPDGAMPDELEPAGPETLQKRYREMRDEKIQLEATLAYREHARSALEKAHCPLLELECPVAREEPAVVDRLNDPALLSQRLNRELEVLRRQALSACDAEEKRLLESRERLAQLDDPRQKRQTLLARVENQEALESRLETERQGFRELTEKVRQLEIEGRQFSALDGQISQQREIQRQYKPEHDLYLQNQTEASQVGQRSEALETARQERDLAVLEAQNLEKQAEEEKSRYSPEIHASLKARFEELGKVIARQETNRDRDLESVKNLEGELGSLRGQAEQLKARCTERDELERTRRAVDFVREVIQQAGPVVTENLLARISHLANQIYTEIMDDHVPELGWDRDYEVTVSRGTEKRAFAQLSGGEQMSAALSVRLALLKEMGDVDFAFFDEPTQNMDAERRSNLADQISRVRDLEQLIVISHDDTFEHHTDHLVRLEKENEQTEVAIG